MGCNPWWLWHPCLLIEQEVFRFSTSYLHTQRQEALEMQKGHGSLPFVTWQMHEEMGSYMETKAWCSASVFTCPSLSQPATKAAALGHVLCTELTHSHRLCYLPLNQRLDSSLTPQKHLRALSHNPGFTLELPGKCNENKFIFILYKLCPSQEIIYASQIQHCVWTTVFFQTLNFLFCIGV